MKTSCVQCHIPTAPHTSVTARNQNFCLGCAPASGSVHLPAAIGGLVGAVLGAAAWAAVAIGAGVSIGYVAILVGWLTGVGVRYGSKGAEGLSFRVLAGALALVSLAAARYVMVAWLVAEELEVSMFSGVVYEIFVATAGETTSAFDVLWIVLAAGAAVRAAAPREAEGA